MLSIRCLTRGIRYLIPSPGQGKDAFIHPLLLGTRRVSCSTPLSAAAGCRKQQVLFPLSPKGLPSCSGNRAHVLNPECCAQTS